MNRIETILPGDVILTSSPKLTSKVINTLQFFVYKGVKYSHAMMVITEHPQVVMHAVSTGVELIELNQLMESEEFNNNWRVMRNLELEAQFKANPDLIGTEITNIASKYAGQSYNQIFGKEGKQESFCSELIVKIYKDLNILSFGREPHKTFPVHLQLLIDKDEKWADVTDIYQEQIVYFSQDAQKFIQNEVITDELLENISKKLGYQVSQDDVMQIFGNDTLKPFIKQMDDTWTQINKAEKNRRHVITQLEFIVSHTTAMFENLHRNIEGEQIDKRGANQVKPKKRRKK